MDRRAIPRARCPKFEARVDWRGCSYIQCGGKKWRFGTAAEREGQYRLCCCGQYDQCRLGEERETMTMLTETKAGAVLTLADYEARIHIYREQIGTGYIGIGRTLIEAKEAGVVPHGEWEAWVERTAGLSARNAQRCMQAAREIREGSALARLEMSKALMLLGSGLEAEKQEELAESAAAESATVKELRAKIEEQKAALETAGRVLGAQTGKTTRAELEALDARNALESAQKELQAERKENADLRGQLSGAREYTDREKERAVQEAEERISKEYAAAMNDLRDELSAAEAREARRAEELESLRADRQRQAMEAARGVTAGAPGTLDVGAAVRAFIGAVGVLPQMGGTLQRLKPREREDLLAQAETVGRWVAGVRAALGAVMVDADAAVV